MKLEDRKGSLGGCFLGGRKRKRGHYRGRDWQGSQRKGDQRKRIIYVAGTRRVPGFSRKICGGEKECKIAAKKHSGGGEHLTRENLSIIGGKPL